MADVSLLRSPGAGRRAGTRGVGRFLTVGILLGSVLSGCATKADLRDVQTELRALSAQQREALDELASLNLAVQDTLRGQSDALFESRGETIRRLREMEQELLTIQELMRLNLQGLATVRDLLEGRGPGASGLTRTDTEPGQRMDMELVPTAPGGGGAVEMYNAAVTQFNLGSTNTARRAFQQFLQQYPNDALAPDAHYYLADIMVQENRLDEAIGAFLRIPELFPTARKVPEALYRVGILYIELNQRADARAYLERVVTSYPESGAAVLARERLAEIR
jgi:tol-pal system protein YbgF